jgi:membrane associated rhomboid family serine protease
MHRDPAAPPLNPLPPVVWLMVLPVAAVEAVLSLADRGLVGGAAGVGWRLAAIQDFAFSAPVWEWMVANRRFPPEHLLRFLTYPFVHVNFTHALFVVVFQLALGKFVGEVFRLGAVLALWLAAGAAGALGYALILGDPVPLVGGYPPVYGLIGAFTFILWTDLGARGANRARAFTLIGVLLAFQLVFGLLFGADRTWVADLSGFAAGFLVSFVLAPGGWARLLARLRQP